MPKLESTPQRVFYLINNGINTSDNRSLWDLKVTNETNVPVVVGTDTGNPTRALMNVLTSEYTEIISIKDDRDNTFSTTKVAVAKITDISRYDTETGAHDDKHIREELPPMKWDDIDNDIVRIINRYYDTHREDRDQLIEYADGISCLTSDYSTGLFIDKDGLPSVEIHGLPLYSKDDDYYLDDVDITIRRMKYDNDYEIIISNDELEEDIDLTISDIRELLRTSSKFNKLIEFVSDELK